MNNIFYIIGKILHYVLNLKITDIPLHIAYTGITVLAGYVVSAFVVDFPIVIYEDLTKKEISVKEKIEHHARVIFIIIFGIRLLYELATKN